MTLSVSPMQRIQASLGIFSGGADTLAFEVSDQVVGDDQLVVLIGRLTAGGGMIAPAGEGWISLGTEVAGAYTWQAFGRPAVAGDAGGSFAFTGVTSDAVGLLAVYRGGPTGAPLIAHIDALDAVTYSSSTSHDAPGLADRTTQTTDVLLWLVWFVSGSVTVTIPTLPDGTELLDSNDAAEGRKRAFETADGMIGSAGPPDTTFEVSSACVATAAIVGLRARALRLTSGLRDAIPGHVGLELESATIGSTTAGDPAHSSSSIGGGP
jgi:hypothetical protein